MRFNGLPVNLVWPNTVHHPEMLQSLATQRPGAVTFYALGWGQGVPSTTGALLTGPRESADRKAAGRQPWGCLRSPPGGPFRPPAEPVTLGSGRRHLLALHAQQTCPSPWAVPHISLEHGGWRQRNVASVRARATLECACAHGGHRADRQALPVWPPRSLSSLALGFAPTSGERPRSGCH